MYWLYMIHNNVKCHSLILLTVSSRAFWSVSIEISSQKGWILMCSSHRAFSGVSIENFSPFPQEAEVCYLFSALPFFSHFSAIPAPSQTSFFLSSQNSNYSCWCCCMDGCTNANRSCVCLTFHASVNLAACSQVVLHPSPSEAHHLSFCYLFCWMIISWI